MAQDAINAKLSSGQYVIRDNRNPIFPCKKGTIEYAGRFVVGTDFTSGRGVDFTLEGAKKVVYAHFHSPTGGNITFAETVNTTPGNQYVKLATATSTTDILFYIIVEV